MQASRTAHVPQTERTCHPWFICAHSWVKGRRVSWWTKGRSSTCYRWCETSSLLKVTSESARCLWPGGKERRFGAQHARTRLALVGSYDTAAFAGDDAELTDWLLLANQVKCSGSWEAKKSQLYSSSTYSSYRAEQRSDCKRRCSPLWFEMLAHGERWHKIKSFHNGCLWKYDTSGQKSVEQRALNTDKVLTAARACARIAPGWASPGKHERGRPQKHGGKAEGGTRGHAAAVTKHPHTSIRHLSVFTSEKLRLYKTLLLHEVMWPVPPAVSMVSGFIFSLFVAP